MLKFQETNHAYYCSDNNYYVDGRGSNNHGRCEYDTWEEFKEEWLDPELDDDYNHVFRFDITKSDDGQLELWLFFILQRKGIYRPVWIKEIKESEMEEINEFLKKRWEYMTSQWEEFSREDI